MFGAIKIYMELNNICISKTKYVWSNTKHCWTKGEYGWRNQATTNMLEQQ